MGITDGLTPSLGMTDQYDRHPDGSKIQGRAESHLHEALQCHHRDVHKPSIIHMSAERDAASTPADFAKTP